MLTVPAAWGLVALGVAGCLVGMLTETTLLFAAGVVLVASGVAIEGRNER